MLGTYMTRALQAVNSKINYLQSGSEEQVSNLLGVPYEVHAERVVLLAVAVANAKNLAGQAAAIGQFASSYTNKSMTVECLEKFYSIFELTYDGLKSLQMINQSDDGDEPEVVERRSVYQQIREFFHSWQNFKQSPIAKKVTEFVEYLVACGFCGDKGVLEYTHEGFTLFSLKVKQKNLCIFDFVEYVISTVMYFLEEGYTHFQSGGTLSQFLSGAAHDPIKYNKEYAAVVGLSRLIANGNMGLAQYDVWSYQARLFELIDTTEAMLKVAPTPQLSAILDAKLQKLGTLRTDFLELVARQQLRAAPYGIVVYGKSAVGKSTIVQYIVKFGRLTLGLSGGQECIANVNMEEKYMSTVKSHTDTLILDDIANGKLEFAQYNPSNLIIQLVNNIPFASNQAAVESKGKISPIPRLVVGTTNVEDLQAGALSNEPASVLRRLDFVQVEVKQEFCIPGTGQLDSSKVPEDPILDIWEFTYCRTVVTPSTPGFPDTVTRVPHVYNGKQMVKVGISDFLACYKQQLLTHFDEQTKLLRNIDNIDKVETCEHGIYKCVCQECKAKPEQEPETPMVNQVGVQDSALALANMYISLTPYKYFLDLLPNADHAIMRRIYSWGIMFEVYRRDLSALFVLSTLFSLLAAYSRMDMFSPFMWYFVCWFVVIVHAHLYLVYLKIKRDYAFNAVTTAYDIITPYVRSALSSRSFQLFGCVAAIHLIYRIYKSARLVNQGNSLMSELPDPDVVLPKCTQYPEQPDNPWKQAARSVTEIGEVQKTTTPAQLSEMLGRRVACVITSPVDGKKAQTFNIVPLKSNIWLAPAHAISKEQVLCNVIRTDPSQSSTNFTEYIGEYNTVKILNKDLSLVYMPNGRTQKDITEYFPEKAVKDACGEMVHKDVYGNVNLYRLRTVYGQPHNETGNFEGNCYQLGVPTATGMCGAPVVSYSKYPSIIGFHLGGVTGDFLGASGFISKQEILAGIAELSHKLRISLVPSAGSIANQSMNIDYGLKPSPHNKSSMNYLTPDIHLGYVATTSMPVARFKTSVKPTIIADTARVVMGIQNTYGPPRAATQERWVPRNTFLNSVGSPSIGFTHEELNKASLCHRKTLFKVLDATQRSQIRVLSEVETVSGIAGLAYVDRIPLATSTGFPLKQPKRKYVIAVEEEIPGVVEPITFTPEIWAEVDKAKDCYRRGERYNFIFSAALKDEVKNSESKKTRMFQCAPVALALLTRKYYLSIIAFMSRVPLSSECCVGTNATGPDWDRLVRHLIKHGKDRLFAGDYAAYDQKMNPAVMLRAFQLLIDIAQVCGYTEDDIVIMRGVMADIVYFVCELDGDLVEFFGCNASGHNLTTHINCIANSLYLRCEFYRIYPSIEAGEFQKYVSLLTYGDDNVVGVSPSCPRFNHTTVQEGLAARGITYTMPDKVSDSIEYIPLEQVTFLKRSIIFNEEVNMYMAPLDEESIEKSLSAVVTSSFLSPEEHSAVNLDGAAREYFYHGKEVYEDRIEKLRQIAKIHNLFPFTRELNVSYEKRMLAWKNQYLPPEPSVG
jgi:hypothetical protein